MPILIAIGAMLVIAAIFGPQIWVRHVLSKYGTERPDLPGTGGELARHLLDRAGLTDVKVEPTNDGDHYDPETRSVRLTTAHHDGRSIAAVAVAAHEVSHAVQHANGERAFMMRMAILSALSWIDIVASVILITSPLVALFTRAPFLFVLQLACGLLLLAIRVFAHIVTLPVEFDASFKKALPVLDRGGYLAPAEMPAARAVLRAAAYTYVAAALTTLLDVVRWARILRP